MNINDMIDQLDRDDRIQLVRNEDQPFPAYEMELSWMEETYADNGPDGLVTIVFEGTTINPVDYTDASGNLDEQAMIESAKSTIDSILQKDNLFLELVVYV